MRGHGGEVWFVGELVSWSGGPRGGDNKARRWAEMAEICSEFCSDLGVAYQIELVHNTKSIA